jgi:hypothetical protein
MRKDIHPKLVAGRIRTGHFASSDAYGVTGAYRILGPKGGVLSIIASEPFPGDNMLNGWEHVSVSLPNRTPNWPEMCFVKDLFWEDHEVVIQLHPAKSEWISNHPYCLHLWRDTTTTLRLPPSILVGVQEAGELKSREEAIAAIALLGSERTRAGRGGTPDDE